MKNIVESAEAFQAYARIDLNYYMLQKLYEDMGIKKPVIVQMIDSATGWAAKEINEKRQTAIDIMEAIIKDKEFIEADVTKDKEMLERIKAIPSIALDAKTVTAKKGGDGE